jgi:hypothetical protein
MVFPNNEAVVNAAEKKRKSKSSSTTFKKKKASASTAPSTTPNTPSGRYVFPIVLQFPIVMKLVPITDI